MKRAAAFLVCVLSSGAVLAQTAPVITTIPTSPAQTDILQITVATNLPCYPATPADGPVTTVTGQTVQIVTRVTCISLTPPPPYTFSVAVGPLPTGQYQIQYLSSSGTAPPALLATAVLPIQGGAAIPTITWHGLVFLIVAIAFSVAYRKRDG